MKQYPSFGSCNIDQPAFEKPGRKIMTDKEIIEEILDTKDFNYYMAEAIINDITNEQWGLISRRVLNSKKNESSSVSFEEYLGTIVYEYLYPVIKKNLDWMVEQYKEKHDITREPDEQ